MTCPTVERVVNQALADLDHDWLREVVTSYMPSPVRQRQVSEVLMEEHGVNEEQADVIAGMSDEVIAALAQRLHILN